MVSSKENYNHINIKAMVCELNSDTDFFDIVTGILQYDILTPFLFIITLDYIQQTSIDLMKKNGKK